MLRRAQLCGIQPIVLLGGATGLIGDPSGKKEERSLLDKDLAADNAAKQKAQLMKFVDFSPGKTQAILANNLDWFQNFSFLDFLRDVGKHITVNYMTAKDSVKIRMETGISYAEFGYMLVQGYDFLHLFEKQNCAIQIGGSDQWGNMTTGLELIRRKHGKEAHALSAPLLTDSAGNKLGKSEKGAIFLDAGLTSPFRFYQYWLGLADADAPKALRYLTFFKDDYIADLEQKIVAEPETRTAQRVLAHELTRLVHGEESALGAENASKVLFSKDPSVLQNLNAKALELLATEVPSVRWPSGEASQSILQLLNLSELASSNGEAKRHVKSGAVSVNREKVTDESLQLRSSDLFASRPFCLLGVGKSKLVLILKD
jgi:tyrosyl-tRNA synthetase